MREKKKRYTIYVGLNDKEEKKQKQQTEKILRLVKHCCKSYGTAFSSYILDGGYIHDNGDFVLEKSICIAFINPDEMVVDEIAKDLCAFLNQESVMVTIDEVECYMVTNSI